MQVSVLRAWPGGHDCIDVQVQASATVADAIRASGLSRDGIAGVAVFGQRVEDTTPLQPGDRVELLRPLLVDPKQARRRRARLQQARD